MFTVATVREHRRRRRRCRAALRQVPLPRRFSLEDFCERVAEHRGRPMRLVTGPLPEKANKQLCGAWFGREHEDLICVEPEVSPLHREHIVLHELGHMLCGHRPVEEEMPPHVATELFPTVSADPLGASLIASMLGRSNYDEPDEVEAEVFATMVGARIVERVESPPASLLFTPGERRQDSTQVLRALSRTLDVDPGPHR